MTVDGGPDTIGFRYGNEYGNQVGSSYTPISSFRLIASADSVIRDHDKLSALELPDSPSRACCHPGALLEVGLEVLPTFLDVQARPDGGVT